MLVQQQLKQPYTPNFYAQPQVKPCYSPCDSRGALRSSLQQYHISLYKNQDDPQAKQFSTSKQTIMEKVRKTYFDPLATSKGQIRDILQNLPVGSAHPFSPEGILLCQTKNGIEEIPISGHDEDFFYNAVDMGDMGETLLRRMAGFRNRLGKSPHQHSSYPRFSD